MSVFNEALKIDTRSAGQATQVSSGFFDLFGFGSANTSATSKTALTLSAFYNGVDQLSNDLAKLPKYILRKDGDQRLKDYDHPVNYLISQRPNDLMTAFDFWKIIEISTILKGNGFARIFRNKSTGYPSSILFLNSDDVQVFRYENKLFYKFKGEIIASEDMLHFKGFSFDGIIGVGIVTFAAKQLGVSLHAQAYANDVYKDRGMSYGVIQSDKVVSEPNKKLLSAGFAAKMSEPSKHKVPVLDEGMQYKVITITPQESQFLETNKLGNIEIARWLNIAPHKLKELGNANYSNMYQQNIEHVQDSIMPRVVSKEQEINTKLFAREEAGQRYCRFNISALLRGDLEMKQKFYTAMVYSGIYTRNEVRALEDMNPIDGLDEVLQPINMQALSVAQQLLNNEKDGNKA